MGVGASLKNSRLGRWFRQEKPGGLRNRTVVENGDSSPVLSERHFLSPQEMFSVQGEEEQGRQDRSSALLSSPQLQHICTSQCHSTDSPPLLFWREDPVSSNQVRPLSESWKFFMSDTSLANGTSPGRISAVSPASPKSIQWQSGFESDFPWEQSSIDGVNNDNGFVWWRRRNSIESGRRQQKQQPFESTQTQRVTLPADPQESMSPRTFELIEIRTSTVNESDKEEVVAADGHPPQVLNLPQPLKEPRNRRQQVEAKNVRKKWLVGYLRGLSNEMDGDIWRPHRYLNGGMSNEYRPEYRDSIPKHSIFNPRCYEYKNIYLDSRHVSV